MRIGLLGDIHGRDDRLEIALTDLQSMSLDMILFVGDVLDGHGSVNRCIDLLISHEVICIKGNHDVHMPNEQSNAIETEVTISIDVEKVRLAYSEAGLKFTQETIRNPTYGSITRASQISKKSRSYLESLPTHREIKTPDGLLLLCHGMGESVYEFVNDRHFDDIQNIAPESELRRILLEKKYAFVVSGHTHTVLARRAEDIAFFNPGALCGGGYAGYCVLDTKICELQIFRFWKEKRRLNGPIRISI